MVDDGESNEQRLASTGTSAALRLCVMHQLGVCQAWKRTVRPARDSHGCLWYGARARGSTCQVARGRLL